MTAVLPLANAGFTYLTDPNTGMRRTGADTQAIQCGGVDVVTATPTGVSITGTLAVSGAFTVGGAPILPIGLGPLPWSGTTAPAKWVLANGQALLRASYPDLWTFAAAEIALGNTLYTNGNGTTTFTVADMRGRIAAGDDNMGGGVGAGRLTAATMTPDGQTLGAVGGGQLSTLSTGNLPAYTPSGSLSGIISTEANIPSNQTASSASGTGGPRVVADWGAGASTLSQIHSTGSFVGSAQGGTSTAFTNVQPTIVTNYIIYAGV